MQEQIKLAKQGKCPFCAASDCDYDDLIVDSGTASQLGQCIACNREWYEVYTLVDIEERDTFSELSFFEEEYSSG